MAQTIANIATQSTDVATANAVQSAQRKLPNAIAGMFTDLARGEKGTREIVPKLAEALYKIGVVATYQTEQRAGVDSDGDETTYTVPHKFDVPALKGNKTEKGEFYDEAFAQCLKAYPAEVQRAFAEGAPKEPKAPKKDASKAQWNAHRAAQIAYLEAKDAFADAKRMRGAIDVCMNRVRGKIVELTKQALFAQLAGDTNDAAKLARAQVESGLSPIPQKDATPSEKAYSLAMQALTMLQTAEALSPAGTALLGHLNKGTESYKAKYVAK